MVRPLLSEMMAHDGGKLAKLYEMSGKRVFVAGHRGMVGSAVLRRLRHVDVELIVADRETVDLREQESVRTWISAHRPDVIFLAAATVGGILANSSRPADFLLDNLLIESNVFEAAYRCGVERLVFLGSSCIYPRLAPQPIPENALLSGPLEPTNQWYAIAKIAGIKLAQAFRAQYGCRYISAMPTNLYGIGDNFNLEQAHVIPALIRKAHDARISGNPELLVWGSGDVRREFLFVDDLADALVFLAEHYDSPEPINVGTGNDITVRELAELIARTVGFSGILVFDPSKPDGTPRKLLDVTRINGIGWRASTTLDDGLARAYAWYTENQSDLRL